MIEKLSGQAMQENAMCKIDILKKIEIGIKAADGGRVLSHDKVKRLFCRFSRETRSVMKMRKGGIIGDF